MDNNRLIFSHALAAGVAGYGLTQINVNTFSLPLIAFGISGVNNTLAFIKHALNVNDMDKVIEVTDLLQNLFVLPSIAGALWLQTEYPKEIANLHPGLSVVPLVLYIMEKEEWKKTKTTVITLNIVSCLVTSVIKQNWFGVGIGILFGCTEGVLVSSEDQVTRADSTNYCLAAALFATLYALGMKAL